MIEVVIGPNFDSKDNYEVLGCQKNAPQEELEHAYKNLSRRYHPDSNVGDDEAADIFVKVGAAYAAVTGGKGATSGMKQIITRGRNTPMRIPYTEEEAKANFEQTFGKYREMYYPEGSVLGMPYAFDLNDSLNASKSVRDSLSFKMGSYRFGLFQVWLVKKELDPFLFFLELLFTTTVLVSLVLHFLGSLSTSLDLIAGIALLFGFFVVNFWYGFTRYPTIWEAICSARKGNIVVDSDLEDIRDTCSFHLHRGSPKSSQTCIAITCLPFFLVDHVITGIFSLLFWPCTFCLSRSSRRDGNGPSPFFKQLIKSMGALETITVWYLAWLMGGTVLKTLAATALLVSQAMYTGIFFRQSFPEFLFGLLSGHILSVTAANGSSVATADNKSLDESFDDAATLPSSPARSRAGGNPVRSIEEDHQSESLENKNNDSLATEMGAARSASQVEEKTKKPNKLWRFMSKETKGSSQNDQGTPRQSPSSETMVSDESRELHSQQRARETISPPDTDSLAPCETIEVSDLTPEDEESTPSGFWSFMSRSKKSSPPVVRGSTAKRGHARRDLEQGPDDFTMDKINAYNTQQRAQDAVFCTSEMAGFHPADQGRTSSRGRKRQPSAPVFDTMSPKRSQDTVGFCTNEILEFNADNDDSSGSTPGRETTSRMSSVFSSFKPKSPNLVKSRADMKVIRSIDMAGNVIGTKTRSRTKSLESISWPSTGSFTDDLDEDITVDLKYDSSMAFERSLASHNSRIANRDPKVQLLTPTDLLDVKETPPPPTPVAVATTKSADDETENGKEGSSSFSYLLGARDSSVLDKLLGRGDSSTENGVASSWDPSRLYCLGPQSARDVQDDFDEFPDPEDDIPDCMGRRPYRRKKARESTRRKTSCVDIPDVVFPFEQSRTLQSEDLTLPPELPIDDGEERGVRFSVRRSDNDSVITIKKPQKPLAVLVPSEGKSNSSPDQFVYFM